ncbi:MAG: hypothetical protein KBH03_08050 [Paludibacteraceae bacterium]|nr:hypothetical protein [Paludibacteraceae bacterium]
MTYVLILFDILFQVLAAGLYVANRSIVVSAIRKEVYFDGAHYGALKVVAAVFFCQLYSCILT